MLLDTNFETIKCTEWPQIDLDHYKVKDTQYMLYGKYMLYCKFINVRGD